MGRPIYVHVEEEEERERPRGSRWDVPPLRPEVVFLDELTELVEELGERQRHEPMSLECLITLVLAVLIQWQTTLID